MENPDFETSNSRLTRPVWWALASLSLSMLLSSLGTSIANVGLPTIAEAFSASFKEVQWVVLAYLIAITSLIVSAGRLGDIIGRRRLLLTGIGVFTLASTLCSVAPTLWLLIAARMAQGLGAAIMMSLTMAFVSETVPANRSGNAMGLLGTMSAVGTALGPTLGGLLIAGTGWRSIFFISLPLGLLTFYLARKFLPIDKKQPKLTSTVFDYQGTAILSATLCLYALAMTMGRNNFDVLNVVLLVTAALGAILFVIVEAKTVSPLIQLGLFRNPILSSGFMMSALVTTVVMATLIVGPFYLSRALLLDAVSVGLVMSSGPIVAALIGWPSGKAVDRFGSYNMSFMGLIGMGIGCLLLTLLPFNFGLLGYIIPLVIVTAGYAIFQTANNTAVMTGVIETQRGVVSGILGMSRNIGLITGTSVMGAVFLAGTSGTNILLMSPEAIAAGMRNTFMVAVVLIAVSLAISILGKFLVSYFTVPK